MRIHANRRCSGFRLLVAGLVFAVSGGLAACGSESSDPACEGDCGQVSVRDGGSADEELYVQFSIESRDELPVVARIVSIDRVDGLQVRAYASAEQLTALAEEGYTFDPLPHPGKNPNAQMGVQLRAGTPTWDSFPRYSDYVDMMNGFVARYPNLCQLVEIGATTNTRRPHKLLALKITDNPTVEEDEPEVYLSSTMHGDETTGYVMLLRLADEILRTYGTDQKITSLVDGTEIWITPLANPDGTFYQSDTTVGGAIRGYVRADGSYSGVDPNRDFPEPGEADALSSRWAETRAMMAFHRAHSFVLGANMHGGAEVVNYPWDALQRLHPDDAWWAAISRRYADQAHVDGPSGYMMELDDGITNGYAWYPAPGSRQDFATFNGGRELTIEVSETKNPSASRLPAYYTANRTALLAYVGEALKGIRGVVTGPNGEPIAATVEVVGHDKTQDGSVMSTDPDVGDFHRLINPGTYTLRVSATGYETKQVTGVVVGTGAATRVDVTLRSLSTDRVTIHGRVTAAANSAAIAGAKVELISPALSTTTDANGNYTLAQVPAGTQQFKVSASGFATVTEEREVAAAALVHDFALDTSTVVTGFTSDFEATDGGLESSGSPAPAFAWGAVSGTPAAHSGAKVWATNLSGTYANNASFQLELTVAVPAGNPVLTFWHWYELESNWDGVNVQVTVPSRGTGDYTVLTPEGGYPVASVDALGGPGYSGASTAWAQASFDLSAYAGETVTLRWSFASDSSVVKRGWLIDDVEIASH